MWFGVVSVFPELVQNIQSYGVVGRGFREGRLALEAIDLRSFAVDRHGTVDDRTYGGGAGMVLRVDVIAAATAAAQNQFASYQLSQRTSDDSSDRSSDQLSNGRPARVIALGPHGQPLNQARVNALAQEPGVILLCGRYEGFDERVHEQIADETLSIGDYVLSGGELPAQVLIDAVARQLPGVLGNPASVAAESHLAGLLDYPHYTRPEKSEWGDVPGTLIGGNHEAIRRWRRQQQLLRTYLERPDLFQVLIRELPLSTEDQALLDAALQTPVVRPPEDPELER